MKKFTESFPRVYYYAVVTLTLAGCIVWQMLCPWCADDLPYSLAPFAGIYSDNGFWNDLGDEYGSLSELWTGISGHAMMSNARLSNLLYIVVQLLPVAVVKFICGLLCAGMYLGLLFLGIPAERRRNPWLVTLVTLLFWVLFPWDDFMQSSDFVFNYPLPSVAVLLWLYFYRRADGLSPWGKVGLALLTVPVAWLHEAFTVPLGAYVFLDWLLRGRRSWYPLLLEAIMVSVVLGMSAIGSSTRLEGYVFSASVILGSLRAGLFHFLKGMSIALLSLFLIGTVALLRRGSERRRFVQVFFPCAGAILCGIAVCIVLRTYERAAWGLDLFVCLALTGLVSEAKVLPRVGVAPAAVFAVLAGGYAFWLSSLCVWQYRSTEGTYALYRALEPRGGRGFGPVYVDRVYSRDLPFYLMGLNVPVDERNKYNNYTIANYFTRGRDVGVLVLPEKFRGVPIDSMPGIPGNAGARGEAPFYILDRPYEGCLSLTGGEYRPGNNPAAPLLGKLKGMIPGVSGDRTEPHVESVPFIDADSVLRYFIIVEPLPASFGNREIVRVDFCNEEDAE